jgi:hypothetical protein
MGYGAAPNMFADLVEDGYLPAQRARGCLVESGEINFAFQQIMLSQVDRELAKAMLAGDSVPEATFRPSPTAPEE